MDRSRQKRSWLRMRPWRHCNLLGKLCIACMIINIIICIQLVKANSHIAFLYLSWAFFCAMGTYSKKCKKQNG
jgi:hypothetical protein